MRIPKLAEKLLLALALAACAAAPFALAGCSGSSKQEDMSTRPDQAVQQDFSQPADLSHNDDLGEQD